MTVDSMQRCFGSRSEERYGAVRGALVLGFAGLGEGHHIGLLPDGRHISVGDREVEKRRQVGDALRAEMFEMEGSEAVWTKGG